MGYYSMNEIPIGAKIKIKDSNLTGNIVEVFHFPTTFKVEFEDGTYKIYKTHEVKLLEDNKEIFTDLKISKEVYNQNKDVIKFNLNHLMNTNWLNFFQQQFDVLPNSKQV